MAEKAAIHLTGRRLSLRWGRGREEGGEWEWCADGEGGEKRGFDEVFGKEVDGR